MISASIPGFKDLALRYLVLDYNGTIAFDGLLTPYVSEHIRALSQRLEIHVLTADTNKTCGPQLAVLPVTLAVIESRPEDEAKLEYVSGLGLAQCVCIGNGMNDRLMLKESGLGIAVIGGECAAVQSYSAAHIVAPGIIQALELLLHPQRLLATLRV